MSGNAKGYWHRYYIKVADYALARIIDVLSKDSTVKNITVGMEDDSLLVAYDYDRYIEERKDTATTSRVWSREGTYVTDKAKCDKCSNAPIHFSTCLDCIEGSNFKEQSGRCTTVSDPTPYLKDV